MKIKNHAPMALLLMLLVSAFIALWSMRALQLVDNFHWIFSFALALLIFICAMFFPGFRLRLSQIIHAVTHHYRSPQKNSGAKRSFAIIILLFFVFLVEFDCVLVLLNGYLDRSEPDCQLMKIQEKQSLRLPLSTFTLYATAMSNPIGRLEINVSPDEYHLTSEGDSIMVCTKQGRLGWKWVADHALR